MVDIIIVTYNALECLKRCLRAVKKNTATSKYFLTVVDNNSSDGTKEFLNKYESKNENVSMLSLKDNLGFCGAANIAIKKTKNKHIVLLDDDAVASKGWLENLLKEAKRSRKVGIVGCKVVFPDGIIHSAEFRLMPMQLVGQDEVDKGQRDYIKECDAVIGACWLMKRELIDKIGYFDEAFYPCQHEDADFCLRARLAGYKVIYNGKVKIKHYNFFREGGKYYDNIDKYFTKWRQALKRFPLPDSHFTEKHMAKGVNYLNSQDFKKALKEFEKLEKFDPVFSEPSYKGDAFYALRKYDEAGKEYKLSVSGEYSPRISRYKKRNNKTKEKSGFKNGERFLRRLIRYHEINGKILNGKGKAKKAQEEFEKSIYYFSILKDKLASGTYF